MKKVFFIAIAISFAFACQKEKEPELEKIEPGKVLINGVFWATHNVDMPGTFTGRPEDFGMFYQWNRKVGWSSKDPIKNSNGGSQWDNTISTSMFWEPSNDPSPEGYQLPTIKEMSSLLDKEKVSQEWITINKIKGVKFTDKNTGESIFLPKAGCRISEGGNLSVLLDGHYWCILPVSEREGAACMIIDYAARTSRDFGRNWGFSVRPVGY